MTEAAAALSLGSAPLEPLCWSRGLMRPAGQLCNVPHVPTEDSADLAHDRHLCDRAHAGDRDALGEILRLYGPRLFRSVLLPRLGSPPAAEEALSITYMKVVERFDQFAWQEVGVYPWLRVVALRVALDRASVDVRGTAPGIFATQ